MTMLGLAVPFHAPTLVGELDANGKRRLYFEEFDERSFADLPARVPLVRHHDQTRRLGWARLEPRATGLHAIFEPVDGSQAAADAVAEVRAGVTKSLSIGFYPSDADEVSTIKVGQTTTRMPRILRRGVELHEVSLCHRGAYPGAEIYAPDADKYEHEQSEAVMAPFREERERRATERRAKDAELLTRLDTLAGVRWGEGSPNAAAEALRSTEPARREGAGYVVLLPRSGLWAEVDKREASNEILAAGHAEYMLGRAYEREAEYRIPLERTLGAAGVRMLP